MAIRYLDDKESADTIKPMSKAQLMIQKYGTLPIRAAETVAGFSPVSPITTGLAEGALAYGNTASLPAALKSGLMAGGTDLALTLGTMGLGKIPAVKNVIKEGLSNIGGLAGIPKKAYRTILDNPELLQGKFNSKESYAKLGKGLSESVEKAEEVFGGNVGKAKLSALKNINTIDNKNISPILDSIKESKEVFSPKGKLSAIDKGDMNRINEVEKALQKSKSVNDVALIVESLRGDLKYGSARTPTGQQILKKVQGQLLKLLPDDLKEANKQYSDLQEMLKEIGERSLGEQNVETLVRNLPNKTLARQEAIQKLGELTGTDIGKQQQDVWARDFFESWLPSKGYTSGGEGGNVFRMGSFSLPAFMHNPILAGVMGASYLPKVHKNVIKYRKPIGKALKTGAAITAGTIGGQE
jgi:hypothetical protein